MIDAKWVYTWKADERGWVVKAKYLTYIVTKRRMSIIEGAGIAGNAVVIAERKRSGGSSSRKILLPITDETPSPSVIYIVPNFMFILTAG